MRRDPLRKVVVVNRNSLLARVVGPRNGEPERSKPESIPPRPAQSSMAGLWSPREVARLVLRDMHS